MTDAPSIDSRGRAQTQRPYHHGDLSRALVLAGRRILETDGPAALSLRAVAREAGVSPAAPYHHFKDKSELLEAVAGEGWHELGEAISRARTAAPSPRAALTEIGVAYIRFARDNPALYRVMYDGAADRADMPDHAKQAGSAWHCIEEAVIEAGADAKDQIELKLINIAAWCAAHGIAEMAGFREFEPLKAALGGEDAFIRAVLTHIGLFTTHRHDTPPA
jgi:AcrR family transcriptional regulator